MESSIHRSRLIWIAVAILIGLALFSALPSLWASGSGTNAEGGGDNPVVGSLPCTVDPDMDLKFFKALGKSWQSGTIMRPQPTLALAGLCGLSRSVSNAWGAAGSVNSGGSSWSLLGLMQAGGMVTSRSAVLSGAASAWTWLPSSYLGGRITMVSTLGSWNVAISESCLALPTAWLCSVPSQPVVDAVFTVSGASPIVPVMKYRVTIAGEVVTVQFL